MPSLMSLIPLDAVKRQGKLDAELRDASRKGSAIKTNCIKFIFE